MITPEFVSVMAGYNRRMNERLYASAARLPDAVRRSDQGAFFGSIHGTLCHLLWADRMWMSRFDGWEKPTVPVRESPGLVEGFDTLWALRQEADARIEAWAGRVRAADLAGDLTWFSGAANKVMTADRGGLLVHFFNHQTHHRGQVHAPAIPIFGW
eukprot:gene13326-13440_t